MRNKKAYFVTAVGTNIGKTIVSSILVNALKADYWKPVQAGTEDLTDSDLIRATGDFHVFPERYLLKIPASPHQAAAAENIEIKLSDFVLPDTERTLIIEGAGGMMVPLNFSGDLVIDIAVKFQLPLIIVSSFYLGSINHTLLTIEYAKKLNLKIALLVFNGEVNNDSLKAITHFYPDLKTAFIPHLEFLTKEGMQKLGEEFAQKYFYELE